MKIDYEMLTDLYSSRWRRGYWESGQGEMQACFHMYFRDYPFKGGFAVASGMAQLADLVDSFSFTDDDASYLASLDAPGGGKLFKPEFLERLRTFKLDVDIDAVAEGTVVFPHEPLVRVTGPIMDCQLIETALLNCVNFRDACGNEGGAGVFGGRGARRRVRSEARPGTGRRGCGPAARRWWVAAPPPPMCWPVKCSACRFRERTRIRG